MSDNNAVPKHLGIILDGNRRWAKSQGLPTLEGHRRGAEVFKAISAAAFKQGVQYVSAYIFSTENWQRKEEEVGYLMKLVIQVTKEYLDEVHNQGIKIVVLGRRDGLRRDVLKAIRHTEEITAENKGGTMALCFNYGGQQEIIDAVRAYSEQGKSLDELSEEKLAKFLYHPEIPPVDLIIRTSGEQRLSNFMLWRAAYAELAFTDKYWPDFSEEDLHQILHNFANRTRRFGK